MQRRTYVITAALVLGLALGAVFGPSLRGSVASAQTDPPTQTPTASKGDTLRTLFLDKLAAALNLQRSALDSAIVTAGTGTLDTAVQQGTLTQAQADALRTRVEAGDVGALLGGRGGPGGHGPGRARGDQLGVRQAMIDAAAAELGITTDELKTQLRSGQTIAQLAAAHNTTEEAVTNAALAAAKTKLDAAVAAGTLTQAQADEIYAHLQQDGLKLGGPGGGRRGGPDRPGTPDDGQTPTATPQG